MTAPNETMSCPKCGCQIFDPYGWGKVIHDINACSGYIETETVSETPPATNASERRLIPIADGYLVDAAGVVYSEKTTTRGGRLCQFLDSYGYPKVMLSMEGRRVSKHVHTLVLLAFRGPKPGDGYQCRHLNGNKLDNRVENLVWGTAKENWQDKVALGEASRGEDHGAAKLSDLEVSVIRFLLKRGASRAYLGALFDVSKTNIKDIDNGILWSHIKPLEH